jgi:peptidoglycan/xylan/chitin deacetylase (PgdA/CDA1 family)
MGFGRSIMRRAESAGSRPSWLWRALGLWLGLCLGGLPLAQASCPSPQQTVYLTFDTGHMGVAPLIAEILYKHAVPVTFFAAHERTQAGDGSLGSAWGAWWKERAAQGHAFASHTHDHAYWVADLPAHDGQARFRIRPSAGPQQGQSLVWSAAQYCEELHRASRRLLELTGQTPLPLFRAPGGKTSPALVKAAQACGYVHVGWAPAGFLGDELPSGAYPNDRLLAQALRDIRGGDVLVAHLGIWSRQDPWAPAVLEPLILGLKRRGLCFATLREHPQLRPWIDSQGGSVMASRLQGGAS